MKPKYHFFPLLLLCLLIFVSACQKEKLDIDEDKQEDQVQNNAQGNGLWVFNASGLGDEHTVFSNLSVNPVSVEDFYFVDNKGGFFKANPVSGTQSKLNQSGTMPFCYTPSGKMLRIYQNEVQTSSDLGHQWTSKNLTIPSELSQTVIIDAYTIGFVNENNGYAGITIVDPFCKTHCIDPVFGFMKTTDAGQSWSMVNDIPAWGNIYKPSSSGNLIYAARTMNGADIDVMIFKLDEQGVSAGFSSLTGLQAYTLTGAFDVDIQNGNNAIIFLEASNGHNIIAESLDGGKSWTRKGTMQYEASQESGNPQIAFRDLTEGFLMKGKKIYHSADNGQNWKYIQDAPEKVSDVLFNSAGEGIAIGYREMVLKYQAE